MENSERAQKQTEEERKYIQSLRSGNKKAIIDIIKEIRKRGRTTILPEVFELMATTEDAEVKDTAVKLLSDLRNKEVIPVMIDAIADDSFVSIQKELIGSCWQSGLDYHEHIMVFIDAAIKSDYGSALEAFTVIENSIAQVEDAERKKCLQKLEKGLKNTPEEKLPLIKELIQMVKK